ncbi:MAG: hypothetical protein Q7K38_00620 [Candidatus Wildermuthbacteria bacterium]|nr:hypothetical protein [Candidatus Wildermuthbacteria bacterium]
MSFKQYIILFVILFFLPIVLGKVPLSPLLDGFKNFSLQDIWNGFLIVLKADWAFYLGWLAPWIDKLKDLIRSNLPPGTQKFVP